MLRNIIQLVPFRLIGLWTKYVLTFQQTKDFMPIKPSAPVVLLTSSLLAPHKETQDTEKQHGGPRELR